MPIAPGQTVARRFRVRPRLGPALTPYLFLAPTLILLGVFVYWPFLHTFYLSAIDWNLNPDQPTEFVGVDNYRQVFGATLFEHGWAKCRCEASGARRWTRSSPTLELVATSTSRAHTSWTRCGMFP